MNSNSKFRLFSVFVSLGIFPLFLLSCGIYSFSGATLSPDIKTVSIDFFFNDAGSGPPNVGQTFTDKLKDYFSQNTSLAIVREEGDLHFEGSIVGYTFTPVAATATGDPNVPDAAALQRLNITVKVSFINTKEEVYSFDKNFSFFRDYDPNRESQAAIDGPITEEILDQIVLDIFTASVANW